MKTSKTKTAKNSFFFKVKEPFVEGRIFKWSPITNTASWRDDQGNIDGCSYCRSSVNAFLHKKYWIVVEGVKCL